MDTPTPRSSKWLRFQGKFTRSPKVNSIEACTPQGLLYGDSPFTQRTTSIPRTTPVSTTSSIQESPLISSTPPRVDPFIYSKTTTPKRQKNYNTLSCCFCEEPLSSTLQVEKIIELTCDHTCHEECLWLLISDSPHTTELDKLFPICEQCGRTTYPQNDSIRDSMVSRYLINPPFDQKFHSLSLQNKNSKDLSIHIPKTSSQQHRHKTHKSRGSSISAISSIVSSVPRSPSPIVQRFGSLPQSMTDEARTKSLTDDGISLALLRSNHITNLLVQLQKNRIDVTEEDIDAMGVLRLVDKLQVSIGGHELKEYIVYLFQYELVLVRNGYTKWNRYPIQHVKISTPNESTFRLLLQNTRFYIKQRDSSILQKWITGFCDLEQNFNSENLTSTVQLQIDQDDQITIPVLLSPIRLSPVTSVQFRKTDSLTLVIDHHAPLQAPVVATLQNICRVLRVKFNEFRLVCSMNELKEVYGNRIEQIGDIETLSGSVNDKIGDKECSLAIISTSDVRNEARNLTNKNQLIIQIGSAKKNDGIIHLSSWDEIMECLINRLEIAVGDDSSYDDDDDDDEIDSDLDTEFDTEFDSDFHEDINTSEDNVTMDKSSTFWEDLFQDIDHALREAHEK